MHSSSAAYPRIVGLLPFKCLPKLTRCSCLEDLFLGFSNHLGPLLSITTIESSRIWTDEFVTIQRSMWHNPNEEVAHYQINGEGEERGTGNDMHLRVLLVNYSLCSYTTEVAARSSYINLIRCW